MRLGKAVAITASVLMAGGLVLSGIAPASAATAGTELTLSIKQLPASVFDTAKVPSNELGTCLAALGSKATTAATRLDWCSNFAGVITLINLKTGKVEGTATMAFIDYASWKVSSRTWNPVIQEISESAATGALADVKFVADGASTCTSGCHVTSNANYTVNVPRDPTWVEKKVGVDSPGSAAVIGALTTKWTFAGVLSSASRTTVGVRCDSRTGYKYLNGCANPSYTPTYNLDSGKYPDIAKFDKAQIAKHPAWATLTRVSATSSRPSGSRQMPCGIRNSPGPEPTSPQLFSSVPDALK